MTNLIDHLQAAIPDKDKQQLVLSLSKLTVDANNIYWFGYFSCLRANYFYKHNKPIETPQLIIDLYIRQLGIIHYLTAYETTPIFRYNIFQFSNQYYIVDSKVVHELTTKYFMNSHQIDSYYIIDINTLEIIHETISDNLKIKIKEAQVNTELVPKVSKFADLSYCIYCPYKRICNSTIQQ